MWKIEKLDESGSRGRWVPVSDVRYTKQDVAERARHAYVEKAMDEAKRVGAWRTPRFRVVKAVQVVACMVLQ